MRSAANKDYVHAKIHALRAGLLSRDEYGDMIRSGRLHERFPDILPEKDPGDPAVTKALLFRHQAGALLLFSGIGEGYRDIFRCFLLLFEARNFRHLVARAFGRRDIQPQWYDVSPFGSIDNSCSDSDLSPEEFRSSFGDTLFGETLSGEEPPDYETIERRLDLLTMKRMLRCADALHAADRAVVGDVMMRRIITRSIAWNRRKIKYHGSENDLPKEDPFDPDTAFAGGAAGRASLENDISRRIHARYSDEQMQSGSFDIAEFELFLERTFFIYVSNLFHREYHGAGPVVSFAWMVYYQILNLFRIVDGFDLKVPPEAIMERIVA